MQKVTCTAITSIFNHWLIIFRVIDESLKSKQDIYQEYIYTYTYIYTYIHIHIYIQIYTYTHTHIYIYNELQFSYTKSRKTKPNQTDVCILTFKNNNYYYTYL